MGVTEFLSVFFGTCKEGPVRKQDRVGKGTAGKRGNLIADLPRSAGKELTCRVDEGI